MGDVYTSVLSHKKKNNGVPPRFSNIRYISPKVDMLITTPYNVRSSVAGKGIEEDFLKFSKCVPVQVQSSRDV